MGKYDEALVKALNGDGTDLKWELAPELIKAHIEAHFRKNHKTGKMEWIEGYDDSRHKNEVHVSYKQGDRVRINNPRSAHHDKEGTIHNYDSKNDDLWINVDGHRKTAFKPHHPEHLDEARRPKEGVGQRNINLPESKKPGMEAMVKEAARWRGAAMNADKLHGEDKRGRLKHSNMTTKGDLDAYLMKKFNIDETTARDVSNHLTHHNVPDDRSAKVEDYKGEQWADVVLENKTKTSTTSRYTREEIKSYADKLQKTKKATLKTMIKQNHRVIDTSDMDKGSLVSRLLVDKFGKNYDKILFDTKEKD